MLFRSDRKSTRLNSSHTIISYAVFCLKKKKHIRAPPRAYTRRPARPHTRRRPCPGAAHRTRAVRQGPHSCAASSFCFVFFFFKDRAPPEISPLPPPPLSR